MAAATPIKIVKRALWRPGWYRLDQPIGVGQFGRFAFFDQPVGDWSLLVTLDDVSEPIADAVV